MKQKIIPYLKKTFQGVNTPVMIIAILISAGMWYLNKLGHTYTDTVSLPVFIENSADNPVGVIRNEHEVECRIEGTGYQLLAYRWFPKRNTITINLRRIDVRPISGTNQSEITLSSLYNAISEQMTDVRLLSILTPRFEITTSPLTTKKLPVRSRIRLDLRNRYMQTGPTRLYPDSVEVKSLGVLLDTMRAVYTDERHYSNVSGSLSGRVGLREIPDVILSVSEVEYDITVEEYTEVDLQLPVVVLNTPEGMVPLVLPEAVSVRLNVSRSNYASVSSGELQAVIDYNDRLTNLGKQYKVQIPAGEGVVVKEITPPYVELVFEEQPQP